MKRFRTFKLQFLCATLLIGLVLFPLVVKAAPNPQTGATTADPKQAVTALVKTGDDYAANGQYDLAAQAYEQALPLAQTLANQKTSAGLLSKMGSVYRRQQQYEQSTVAYQQAAPLWHALKDPAREARALLTIGTNYVSLNDGTAALQAYEQALAIAPTGSDVAAKTLSEMGELYVDWLQPAAAQKVYLHALPIWLRLGDRAEETSVRQALWKIYMAAEQYADAIAIVNVEVGIASPSNGAVVAGQVTVSGLAQHPQFRKWQLDLLINGDENQVTNLSTKSRQVWGKLLTFDSTQYPNGEHKLRLRVVRSDTNYDEYFATLTISN